MPHAWKNLMIYQCIFEKTQKVLLHRFGNTLKRSDVIAKTSLPGNISSTDYRILFKNALFYVSKFYQSFILKSKQTKSFGLNRKGKDIFFLFSLRPECHFDLSLFLKREERALLLNFRYSLRV